MISPRNLPEEDALGTLLTLASSFLPGAAPTESSNCRRTLNAEPDLPPDSGRTSPETKEAAASIALAHSRYQLLIDQLPAATFMAWLENGRCEPLHRNIAWVHGSRMDGKSDSLVSTALSRGPATLERGICSNRCRGRTIPGRLSVYRPRRPHRLDPWRSKDNLRRMWPPVYAWDGL